MKNSCEICGESDYGFIECCGYFLCSSCITSIKSKAIEKQIIDELSKTIKPIERKQCMYIFRGSEYDEGGYYCSNCNKFQHYQPTNGICECGAKITA